MLYLGIDLHRKQLTVNLRNEKGDVVLKRQVSTSWEKVMQFFDHLAELAAVQDGFTAIMEICGFNDWLVEMLHEYGCRKIVLVQPENRDIHKTDRRDANQLSQLLWLNRQRLQEGKSIEGVRQVRPPSARDAENRQLTSMRKRLGDCRTRTLNQLHRLLLKHNLHQECPVKRIQTKAARMWLASLDFEKIDRLQLNLLTAQWELQDRQIAELQREIENRQRQDPVAAIIATVPGMQAYSSLTVASRIGVIENFPRPGSLANYWGLTPGCRNSGDVNQRLGSITKRGSVLVRFILGQVILHVLRKDPAMKAWFLRIKKRRGAKIARVAAIRRLATILWHMVKHQVPYRIGQMMDLGRTTTALETSPAGNASIPAPVFGGITEQKNVGKPRQQKRPRPSKRPRSGGTFFRPDPGIPCRVAPQQSPTPLPRTESNVIA
jgi:transposase